MCRSTIPAPLNYAPPGYRPFPKAICTSVNHQVCHGIPGDKALKNGDVVNIDVTVIKDGFHGDTSRMFFVGEPSIAARRLSDVTYDCMWLGIAQVRPGATIGDIGHAIQVHAEKNGYSVVREFCGHGIGRKFHEEPQILHYGKPGTLEPLTAGMIFTVEPMINAGRREIKELADGWTIVTKDHSLSAQWEHTVLVTDIRLRSDDAFGRFACAARVHSTKKCRGARARARTSVIRRERHRVQAARSLAARARKPDSTLQRRRLGRCVAARPVALGRQPVAGSGRSERYHVARNADRGRWVRSRRALPAFRRRRADPAESAGD